MRKCIINDLFAGRGYYEDGTESTPILILKKAIKDPDLREMLITIFNDKDLNNIKSLEESINRLDGIKTLKYYPQISNNEVEEEFVKELEKIHFIPTLFFVDPYGYKGLSLRLISALIKDWGCDCIFFFNYNRINPGLSNPAGKEHMDALFGESRAQQLRERLKPLNPLDRELSIVEEIAEALKEMGGTYVLPFCFKNDRGTRTSHHIIFVSKHQLGYEIMKDIMAKESSNSGQGIPSFMYCPATRRQSLLYEFSRTTDELGQMLLTDFAGRTLTVKQIFDEHNIGKPFILKNYQNTLKQLEASKKVKTEPSADKRRKIKGEVTFSEKVKVTFPPREV